MKHRKLKTILCLILIPILAAGLYFTKVSTYTSLEKSFRQAERAAMVGPGEILANIPESNYNHDLIAARTQYGVMIYTGNWLGYRKMGDAPVVMAGNMRSPGQLDASFLPVFLFHKCEKAVAAKLELTIPASRQEDPELTYLLESETTYDGLFRFTIRIPNGGFDAMDERNALDNFYQHCNGYRGSLTKAIPATAWFYDSAGTLLETHEIAIRTNAGEAHAERNDLP